MTRTRVGWPSGTKEMESSEIPQRSIDLEYRFSKVFSCFMILVSVLIVFKNVHTRNMEFCALRRARWLRPSHNLGSREVLYLISFFQSRHYFRFFLKSTWNCKVQVDIVRRQIADIHRESVVGKRVHKELIQLHFLTCSNKILEKVSKSSPGSIRSESLSS